MTWRWRIKDFRNLDAQAELEERLTLVVGPNASGKTSLLEALYWIAYGRSFRARRTVSVLRRGEARALVRLEWPTSQESVELWLTDSASRLHYQGQPISFAEWRKRWPLLYVGGREWVALSGRPSGRRKLLDESLLALFPEYQAWRRRYRQAWLQRARALAAGWPEAARRPWDEAFVQAGAKVWEARLYLVRHLREALSARWERLFPRESIEVRLWNPAVPVWEPSLPTVLRAALQQAEAEEVQVGQCRVGPHRDDLLVRTGTGPFWENASAGQVRGFLIAWADAVAEMAEKLGKPPMLLLIDDFDAEVDTARAHTVLEWLARRRAVVTTHRRSWLRSEAFPGQRLEIRGGRLRILSA